MQNADNEEEAVAPEIQGNCSPSPYGGTVDEENHARAEEQREQPHELLVDEDFAEYSDRPVKPGLRTARTQIQIFGQSEPEGYGIHQQYAEHSDAANQIKAGYAGGLANRTGFVWLRLDYHLKSLAGGIRRSLPDFWARERPRTLSEVLTIFGSMK